MLISCTSRLIILGIYGSRTEEARSSLPCVSIYGIDPSSRPLGARYVFALPSLSLCTSATIFPVFCLLCILPVYAILPYYLPHARRPGAFRETVASHSTSLFSRCASRCAGSLVRARGPGTTKCQNLLDLHASLRPGNEKLPRGSRRRRSAEYRITNFEFLRLISQSDSRREYLPVNIG